MPAVMDVATNLFRRITERKQEWNVGVFDSLKQLIIAVGNSELGIEQKQPIHIESAADILEANDVSEADFRVMVDIYKKRVQHGRVASQLPKIKARAEQAEAEWKKADLEEGQRRRAAMEKLNQLELAASQANAAYQNALESDNFLFRSAGTCPEEVALIEENRILTAALAAAQLRVLPNVPAGDPTSAGFIWPNAREYPAALVVATQRALDAKRVAYTPARRAALERQLEVAKKFTAEAQADLKKIEKQHAELQARLAEFGKARTKPESFAVMRAKPSRDERAKQNAAKLGYAQNDPGWR